MIWDRLIKWSNETIEVLNKNLVEYKEPGMERFNNEKLGWVNRTWNNRYIRRAHLDVVDVRETKGLWMAHLCLFPMLTNGGPIYGFDIIAGEKKVTGAFHDFSPLLQKDHPLTKWFIEENKWYKPSKERELPDWAKAIFSGGMVAAALKTGIRSALLSRPARLMEGHLRLTLHSSLTGLGPLYAILSKRRGKVLSDTMVEGTDLISIVATIPHFCVLII